MKQWEFFTSWLFLYIIVLVGHELNNGQEWIKTTSYNGLWGCQPTKFNQLIGSCFHINKGSPIAFWLSWSTCAKMDLKCVRACEF